MGTGLAWDERCMWHDTGLYFGPYEGNPWIEPIESPENAQGKRRIKNLLDASGLSRNLTDIEFEPASETDVLKVHTPEYFAEVRRVSDASGGNLARRLGTTWIGPGGLDSALLAAGGAIGAVKAVLDGVVDNAYALIRPPGHHAEPGEAMGFCVFANAAMAAMYALVECGLDRVALVDWDVHHGNGTQAIFWEDPRALTISIHQENCFPPGSGGIEQNGGGKGAGTVINIPLPPGSGEAAYLAAFDRVVLPALNIYQPQMIMVPCGFDAGFHDPLGRMMLTSESFRQLTARIQAAALELCNGKLILIHEGGYSLHMVPFHCLAVLEQLSGVQTGVVDPYGHVAEVASAQGILPHQHEAVTLAETLIKGLPEQHFKL